MKCQKWFRHKPFVLIKITFFSILLHCTARVWMRNQSPIKILLTQIQFCGVFLLSSCLLCSMVSYPQFCNHWNLQISYRTCLEMCIGKTQTIQIFLKSFWRRYFFLSLWFKFLNKSPSHREEADSLPKTGRFCGQGASSVFTLIFFSKTVNLAIFKGSEIFTVKKFPQRNCTSRRQSRLKDGLCQNSETIGCTDLANVDNVTKKILTL